MKHSNNEDSNLSEPHSSSIKSELRYRLLTVSVTFVGLLLTSTTVLAQTNNSSGGGGGGGGGGAAGASVFCESELLGSLTSIAAQTLIVAAVVFAIVTWVLTSMIESLPVRQETKAAVKRQRQGAIGGAAKALIIPALLISALDISGVIIPSCVNILPF